MDDSTFLDDEYKKQLFDKFVLMLRVTTLSHLGKITNPYTNDKTINYEVARESIDMLELLFELTFDKMTPEYRTELRDMIAELQIDFVSTLSDQTSRIPKNADE
jgi:hypothetical protein